MIKHMRATKCTEITMTYSRSIDVYRANCSWTLLGKCTYMIKSYRRLNPSKCVNYWTLGNERGGGDTLFIWQTIWKYCAAHTHTRTCFTPNIQLTCTFLHMCAFSMWGYNEEFDNCTLLKSLTSSTRSLKFLTLRLF